MTHDSLKRSASGATFADEHADKRVKQTEKGALAIRTNRPRSNTPVETAFQPRQVYVFGDGGGGELGLGPTKATNITRPRLNPYLANLKDLATGGMHCAAISTDNQLLTWGTNDDKALGRSTEWEGGLRDIDADDSDPDDDVDLNPLEATPTAIKDTFPTHTEFVQVAAGDSTTFVVTAEGLVYGCGTFRDDNGIYGFSLANNNKKDLVKHQPTFALVAGLRGITSIASGADFALALDHNGRIFAWGPGLQGQLGRRIVLRRREQALIPARVELPKHVRAVSIHTGNDHAFAIDSNGDTWAWGLNNFAQTGIADLAGESEAIVYTPKRVPSLAGRNMLTIKGGRHHSIGVTQAGQCVVWGRMDLGHSGLDVTTLPVHDSTKVVLDGRGKPRILLEPTALPIPRCIHATAGSDHCIAVTADGQAYSWGLNATYQCGQGNSDDIDVAKLMVSKSLKGVKVIWAGAGGQYSMLAAVSQQE